jgi:AcrR family transcriptional regulator
MRAENSPSGRRGSFIEEARRAQIIAAAAQTVAEVGYANASLARIAERADISKSVISYHFDGKDELLTLLVTQFFESAWTHMRSRMDAEATAAGKVRAWVSSELEYYAKHRTDFLAAVDVFVNHRAPDGSRPFDQAAKEEVAALSEVLAAGQRTGEFRAFDPPEVATIIIRCVEGVLSSWVVNEGEDLTAQSAALLEFIDHAIRRQER